MAYMTRILALGLVSTMLAACVSVPDYKAPSYPRPTQPRPAPAPAVPPTSPTPPTRSFMAPQVMRLPGLENVIGRSSTQLQQQFGQARLNVQEGDATKLQFTGQACVLDIYLYPLSPGAPPVATHIEARRASDGRDVDRAACVAALGRR